MEHSHDPIEAFIDCAGRLLATPEVRSMHRWRHHFDITCYQHSVFVAYVSFRLAKRFGLDYAATTRAALLHDLYLYDPADQSAHPGNQCLDHPQFALRNARQLCGDLTPLEENAIVAHMWPLALQMPHSREAIVVSAADKLCTVIEVLRGYPLFARKIWRAVRGAAPA